MQGESPHVQVKDPYSSFHSAKPMCTMYACSLSSRDPPDWDVNWSPLCRKSHPLCRLKNPTVVYMITYRLSFCKTGVYNVCLLIILERGCSSMYRKKERLDKSYAKEPLLAFFKSYPCFVNSRSNSYASFSTTSQTQDVINVMVTSHVLCIPQF